MGLLLAGIDEAGYGPLLGPLCVGCSMFHVEHWSPGEEAPELWTLLKTAVTRRAPASLRHSPRIAVADSKEIKLANSVTTKHPLIHLERGVLCFLRVMGSRVANDAALFAELGARCDSREWYGGEPKGLPVGQTAGEVAIGAARLAGALETAGVVCRGLHCEIVPESTFNETVRRTGSKGDANLLGIGEHIRRVLDRAAGGTDEVRIVCDRLGGRTTYQRVLEEILPGRRVETLEESANRSRYLISDPAPGRRVIIQFMVEGESAHLPVALASMIAKYVRELAMMRFNRYWCARIPELRPTAGYRGDAWRWLRDASPLLSQAERSALVRLA